MKLQPHKGKIEIMTLTKEKPKPKPEKGKSWFPCFISL